MTIGDDLTDDRGLYRLHSLPPGNYVIGVAPPQTSEPVSTSRVLRTYYPGTNSLAAAQVVAVRNDIEETISLTLKAVPVTSISGVATTANGMPAGYFEATLRGVPFISTHDDADVAFVQAATVAGTRIGKDGAFSLTGVPAGNYTLVITNGPSGRELTGPMQMAERPVEVRDVPITDLRIATAPLTVVRGRLESVDERLPPGRSFATLRAMPVGEGTTYGSLDADVQPDGRFEFVGLYGLRRIMFRSVPMGWAIASVDAPQNVQDGYHLRFTPGTTVENVVVRVTNRTARVLATVTDDDGSQYVKGWVLLLPVDPADLGPYGAGLQATQQNYGDGGVRYYRMDWVLPGSYLAVAIDIAPYQLTQDAALMERARAAATPVEIRFLGGPLSLRLVRLAPFVQAPTPESFQR